MADVTAAAVKALRERTGLPMMDCKRALLEAGGDEEAAIELLRKAGAKTAETQAGRATTAGRIAVYTDPAAKVGAIIELKCETAPVSNNEEFVQLAADLARQLANGPGASTPDELLSQPSPSKPSMTLKGQYDDLYNRIRENFRFERLTRIDGTCAGYVHHNGATGVLIELEGDDLNLARDISMHVVAMRPTVVSPEDLDPELVAKEREILSEQARQEGKPENIIEKMIEGRLRKELYARHCLDQQVFVKAEDGKSTVGKVAKAAGVKILRFVHWEVGKD